MAAIRSLLKCIEAMKLHKFPGDCGQVYAHVAARCVSFLLQIPPEGAPLTGSATWFWLLKQTRLASLG